MASLEENVLVGFINKLKEWPLPEDWTWEKNIARPKIAFEPVTDEPFVQTNVQFEPGIETDIALELETIRPGMFQCNVMWPTGQGMKDPLGVRSSIRTFFRRGTEIYESGTLIRIIQDPEDGPSFDGSVHDTYPLTIRWIVYP